MLFLLCLVFWIDVCRASHLREKKNSIYRNSGAIWKFREYLKVHFEMMLMARKKKQDCVLLFRLEFVLIH